MFQFFAGHGEGHGSSVRSSSNRARSTRNWRHSAPGSRKTRAQFLWNNKTPDAHLLIASGFLCSGFNRSLRGARSQDNTQLNEAP